MNYARTTVGAAQYVYDHRVVAARALARPLPSGSEVHHVDGDGTNNTPSNLVLCESRAYHKLLHARERALREGGDANLLRCNYCKKYDEPKNLYVQGQRQARHRACFNAYQRRTA